MADVRIGLALENFSPYPKIPDIESLLAYSRRAEELGFDSLWVWDHTLLGVDPRPWTPIDSLTWGKLMSLNLSLNNSFEILRTHSFPGMDGFFVHPVSDAAVMAGNGTIGLEILEDLPAVDAIVIPYGGGGLSCGIGSAVRALKPGARLYAGEVDTAAPLAASLAAGEPVSVTRAPSFVDGIGGLFVMPELWPLARRLLDGALVMTIPEVTSAVRLLVERNRVVAEGAGATSVAAALAGKAGTGKVVCVVSGGNIDTQTLTTILRGEMP